MLLLMVLKDHCELRTDMCPESLVLTPPSGSGEAWAPSSSFSRFWVGSRWLLGASAQNPAGVGCQHGSQEQVTTQMRLSGFFRDPT